MPVSPPLLHTHSTGDLSIPALRVAIGLDTPGPEARHQDAPAGVKGKLDLLEELTTRSEAYRDIKITTNNTPRRDFTQRISFDTVNLRYNNDEDEFDDPNTGGYDWNTEFRGRQRGRSPSPSHNSPLQSPNNSNLMVGGGNSSDPFGVLAARMLSPMTPEYPTTPIITHKGCTFTKFHKDFDNLYQGRLNNKENGFKKPVLRNRVILVYISGRKHTWVALDWILNKFVEDGDTVIVVSAINKGFDAISRKKTFFEAQRAVKMTPKMRLRQRHRPENVKVIASRIMDYMLCILKPGAIVKLTVELCVGETKEVLKDMYKLYEPNLAATGTKAPNSRIGAPLKSWNSSKLTDRLVKNFPLPLIVVPVVNMQDFELQLEAPILKKKKECTTINEEEEEEEKEKDIEKSEESDSVSSDDESINSMDSDASYSSFDEISKLYHDYHKDLKHSLQNLKHNKIDENYFSQFMIAISDKSITFCQNVRDVDPDFKGRGAKLARAITGSNTFGSIPYKTKSLLEPVNKPIQMTSSSTTNSANNGPALSYKELKRLATQKSTSPQPPHIKIDSPSPVEAPSRSSIKFVKLESPPNRNTSGFTSKSLQKSLSHDMDRQIRPALQPSISQPDIVGSTSGYSQNSSNEELRNKEKKKKKKFWKLF